MKYVKNAIFKVAPQLEADAATIKELVEEATLMELAKGAELTSPTARRAIKELHKSRYKSNKDEFGLLERTSSIQVRSSGGKNEEPDSIRRSEMKPHATIAAIALLLFVFALAPNLHSAPQIDQSADTKAIRDLETDWQNGWNRHDISALADLFTDDADFVTVIGKWCKGKKEFYDYHVRLHQVMFRDGVWKTTNTQIRFVKANVAIVHVNWGITGDRDADGTPRGKPRDGIFTQVMVKQNGQWRIAALQNTKIEALPAQLKWRTL